MEIDFDIDECNAHFVHHPMTGKAELQLSGKVMELQSPYDPSTRFRLSPVRQCRRHIGDHNVMIERRRHILFGAFRPQSYRILVDDRLVASAGR